MNKLKAMGNKIAFLERGNRVVTGTIKDVLKASRRYCVVWDDGYRTTTVCADSNYIIEQEQETNQTDAQVQYLKNTLQLQENIRRLTQLANEHYKNVYYNGCNWTHAGDIAHVNDKLDEVIQFMSNDDDE